MAYPLPQIKPFPPLRELGGGLYAQTWTLGLTSSPGPLPEGAVVRQMALDELASVLLRQGYADPNPEGFYDDFSVLLTPTPDGLRVDTRFRVGARNGDAFIWCCIQVIHRLCGPVTTIQGLAPQAWEPWVTSLHAGERCEPA